MVYDETLIVESHAAGHRDIGHAQFIDAVVAKDAFVLLFQVVALFFLVGDQLFEALHFTVLREVVEQADDRPAEDQPDPGFTRTNVTLLFAIADFRIDLFDGSFDGLLRRHDLLCRSLVIAKQDLGLILIQVGGVAENFSFHKFKELVVQGVVVIYSIGCGACG